MNIKSLIKVATVFAGITAAILVTDKVVDRIVDGKQENKSNDNESLFQNDEESETNETPEVAKNNNTVAKAAVKAVVVTFAGLAVFEYGLERGVTSGAAFFTKTPTTYEEAKDLVSNPDSFHKIMSLIRKAR